MQRRRFLQWLGLGTIAASLAVVMDKLGAIAAPVNTTSLQSIYQASSSAHLRYLAFADQAAQEGYFTAASLFQAAAMAEQIHLDNLAKAMGRSGITPIAQAAVPTVASTEENLVAALQATRQEIAAYQQLVKSGGVVIQEVLESKRSLEQLYQEIKAELGQEIDPRKSVFFVCSVCGYTTRTLPDYCPDCGVSSEQFRRVQR